MPSLTDIPIKHIQSSCAENTLGRNSLGFIAELLDATAINSSIQLKFAGGWEVSIISKHGKELTWEDVPNASIGQVFVVDFSEGLLRLATEDEIKLAQSLKEPPINELLDQYGFIDDRKDTRTDTWTPQWMEPALRIDRNQ